MLALCKRLALGVVLIVAAAAVLLLSDLRSRAHPEDATPPAGERTVRVALLQHASQLVLDQGVEGVIAGLRERGWIEGKNLELKRYNSQGDMTVAQTMAKEMAGGGYDLLISVSTVSTQAVARANVAGKTPQVFGLVSDPYGAGIGISRENHLEHPAHLAGYGTMQPVDLAFRTARQLNPKLARVGVVWNAAESNSEAQMKIARATCKELGIELLEATVDSSAGVGEAASALVARGAQALWMAGDVTVLSAADAVIGAGQRGKVPVFTVIPPNVKKGALFDIGADYVAVGTIIGELAGEILNGKKPADVAVDNVMPELLTLNEKALKGVSSDWSFPKEAVGRAQLIVDAEGVEHARADNNKEILSSPGAGPALGAAGANSVGDASASAAIPQPEAGRVYKVAFAAFAPEPSLDSCQKGLLEGLAELGFVEGKNLVVQRSHAQGEMINILPMIQNADQSDADVIVPFSTPVLQSALSMAKHKPIVFTYITDPIAAGAGKTFTDHAPNVTGIGSLPPIAETMKVMQRSMPGVRRLGTLYNAGEANSVKIISLLREVCRRARIELVELTVASSNEVFPAAQGLVARGVQAIYVPSDNTAYLAFAAIVKVAATARLPIIADDPEVMKQGATMICGPGFYYSGKAAAPSLARVLLGESPARIPFANVSVNVTEFNYEAAAKLGLSVANPSRKTWHIAVVLYSETPPAEETLAGMAAAWKRSPLVAGKDYVITLYNAQGDMASVGGIMDAALTGGADIVVPLSTPTLQAAVHRVKRIPVVFGLVSNPMVAGAGKSYTDHLPQVTGITVLAPFNEALDLVQKYFPQYRRLGTLFCPAEANSVELKRTLEEACRQRGLQLESVAVNTSGELSDSALALVARPIDAVLQLSDNLSSAGFTAITRAARGAHKPLISLNSTAVSLGAPLAFGRDYADGGEALVGTLERVIAGESTADIPFKLPPKVVVAMSQANATAVGMTLPPALLKEATH